VEHVFQAARPARLARTGIKLTHVLVPIDFSGDSAGAIACAAKLARQHAARLTLLHVIDLNFNWPDTGPVNAKYLRQEMLAEAKEKIGLLLQTLNRAGLACETVIEEGAPWERIVACAARQAVDLILLAPHPPRRFWQLFHRHTARRVIEHAACPVLVLAPSAAASPELSPASLNQ
jgi:nucleotide-binding universal stress UspA family protein